jgi:phage FluMu gp28-like protein
MTGAVAPKKSLMTSEERLNYADAFIHVDQKPIDLDFWQEKFLCDKSKYSITLKSRRTGFSFATGLKGLVKAMDPARFNYTRQFVSYNEEDAKEKIRYVQGFYHSIPKKYRKPLVSETKTMMEFYDRGKKTTSRLISIACRPPRGRGGDIVFDEMAIYPANRARIIYSAGLPVVARGGCVEIGSTPLGKVGMFYDIFTNPKEGGKEKYPEYLRLYVPWWFAKELCKDVSEAVKLAPHMETQERVELFGTDSIKTIFNSMFLEDFQQEFECTFIDSAMSYITLDLIHANTPGMRELDRVGETVDGAEEDVEVKVFRTADDLLAAYSALGSKAIEKYGRLYLGYDVARRRDAAVIFVIGHLPNGKKLSVAEIEMKNETFEFQLDQFRKIMKSLPVVRACIDQTGQGEPLCETLQKEFGETKVEGVLFNQESKEMLAINVRTGLEKFEFLLQNDSKFHRQIHSIKRIPTSGGHFRYDSERDVDGHADSFWAWTLADNAIIGLKKGSPGFYQKLKAKKEGKETNTGDGGGSRPASKRGKSYAAVIRGMNRTRK